MDSQQILLIVAIAAFVVAGVFLSLAIHVYVSQDIRGVRNDLSGRTRQRGVAASIRGEAGSSRRAKRSSRSVRAGGDAVAYDPAKAMREEDAIETHVNTLRAQRQPPLATPIGDVDAIPTVVVHATEYAMVAEELPDDGTPLPDAVSPQRPVSFTVTQRIVYMHSEGVIAAG